jgi:hypothetical protein
MLTHESIAEYKLSVRPLRIDSGSCPLCVLVVLLRLVGREEVKDLSTASFRTLQKLTRVDIVIVNRAVTGRRELRVQTALTENKLQSPIIFIVAPCILKIH